MSDPDNLVAEIEALGGKLGEAKASITRRFIGQERVVDLVLSALLCGGHGLLIGLPGLGKTRLVDTLGTVMGLATNRIQFTPDLMPADILGSEVLETGEDGKRAFRFIEGPIFCQLLMADEINRASPRTQSALLQAMQEKEVTIAGEHRPLGVPFHVLATQNPIEQEGTYPLPEAQVDRFMLKLRVGYPSRDEELEIMNRMAGSSVPEAKPVVRPETILKARGLIADIYVDEKIKSYILDIVFATREPAEFGLADLIAYGASPRASIYLSIASRAHAFLRGRAFVTPEDVKAIAMDVLRHRVIITYEAEAEELTSEDVVQRILDSVEVP